jgi:hypothetical protein
MFTVKCSKVINLTTLPVFLQNKSSLFLKPPCSSSLSLQESRWCRCVSCGCTAPGPARRWPTPATRATGWARGSATSSSWPTPGNRASYRRSKTVWWVRAVSGMVRGGPAGRLHHRLRLEQGQARTGQTQDDNIFFFKCFLFLIVTSQKIFQMGITNII